MRAKIRLSALRAGVHKMKLRQFHLIIMLNAAALSACGPVARPVPIRPPILLIAKPNLAGLERVMGRDAPALTALFGLPDQDIREENARKLQFGSGICILDAYLYAPAKGKEPIVSYIDVRQPDGKVIDRASCVAALTRRKEAR